MSRVVVIDHRAEVARLLVERLRENHVVEYGRDFLTQRRKGAKAQRKTLRNAAALCAFAPLRQNIFSKQVDCVVYSPPFPRREDVPDLADAETIFQQCAHAGVRQFVLISSAAIYGATPQNPGLIRETRAPLKEKRFEIARGWVKLEQLAEKYFGDGVVLTILRPAALLAYGGEDYFTRLFRSRFAVTLPGHDPSLQLLSPADLVNAVKRAIEQRAAGVFNVAPQSVIPLRKALRLANTKRIPVPRSLQRPVRAVLKPFRVAHPLEQLDYIRYSWSVSGEKIKNALGFEPTHSTAGALAQLSGHDLPADVETEFDDFGMDTRYVSALGRTVFKFLERYYWRIEISGVEQIPREGPAVLVGMHRGFMPFDGIMLIHQLLKLTGRCPRFLMHPGLVKMPFSFNFLFRLGGVIACQDNADRMLKRGELLGVFPEGIKGAFALYREAYRLQKFGRNDFVKMALRHQVPIVPFVTIGSAEMLPIVKKFEWDWWKRRTDWPCLPLTLSPLPLPTKWHTQFLPPVEIKDVYSPEAVADSGTVRAISVEVRSRMEAAIENILSRRKSIFFGSVFEQEAS